MSDIGSGNIAGGFCMHGLPIGSCSLCMTTPGIPVPSYTLPPAPIFQPMGCICPPGANKDCENPMCPRKGCVSATGART